MARPPVARLTSTLTPRLVSGIRLLGSGLSASTISATISATSTVATASRTASATTGHASDLRHRVRQSWLSLIQ